MDVRDPRYGDWGLLMKKNHLSESEIQQYETLTLEEISSVFFKLGVSKGAQLFFVMLQSYRIAARVANAAWGLVQSNLQSPEELKRLQQALRDYSPNNFAPHRSDIEFAAECFEEYYNEAAKLMTMEEREELLFQWTAKLHRLAEQAPRVKLTAQDILHAEEKIRIHEEYNCIDVKGIFHIEKDDHNGTPLCGCSVRGGNRVRALPSCAGCISLTGT